MPLREDILKPIPGDNPSGQDLRYAPVYDKIKEARREDDNLAQGAWQFERKVADWAQVVRLTQDAIATQSKDLQLAAWLTEAAIKRDGIRGFRECLDLCRGLLEQFWDTLYPVIDEGDMEDRLAPLEWISTRMLIPVRSVALTRDGYHSFQYKDSRTVGYEDQAKTKEQKATRDKLLKEGKLAAEVFDKSFGETPKAFYADLEKQFDGSIGSLNALDQVCGDKFGDSAPAFGKLKESLEEVRHIVHQFLQKKREAEPDPVEEAPPPPPVAEEAAPEAAATPAVPAGAGLSPLAAALAARAVAEPADRQQAIASVVAAASALRRQEPFSPAPYLMLRGLRWGELRASSDPGVLEAPPTDLRRHVKYLALENKWRELLDLAENIMALPCSRAWLDLQRLVVEGCTALGDNYRAITVAVRSEIRALVRDLPNLPEAILNDDTPAANPQTQAWIRELMAEPWEAPAPKAPAVPVMDKQAAGWQKKYVDPHALALEAIRSGTPQKAVEILQQEVSRQTSGRGRFQRRLQLAQICVAAGKDAIAQPLLDDIAAAIENHKLDDWEDRETVAAALSFLMQTSKKIQGDAKLKQAMFERICRLDPVQALSV